MLCGQAALVNPGKSAFRAISLMCRCWSCAVCAPVRKNQLVALILAGKPEKFITLTSDPATGYCPEDRARTLARAWPVIVRRAKKEFALARLSYLAVFERNKKGEPHLHIAVRCGYIPQKWLSDQLLELTGARIVDIRAVREQGGLARYLAKYLGKDPHHFEGTKRYWRSQDWELDDPDLEPEDPIWSVSWYVVRRSQAELKRLWASWDWDTAMEGRTLVAMQREPP